MGPRGMRKESGKGSTMSKFNGSPNIVRVIICRRMRRAGHLVRMVEGRSAFNILSGNPSGRRPLGRPRRR